MMKQSTRISKCQVKNMVYLCHRCLDRISDDMSKGMLVDGGLHLEYESDFVVWESYFFTHS